MDRGEHEFDGPLGGEAFGFERVGEAEAADGEVGAGGPRAGELQVDVLTLGERRAFGEQGEVGCHQVAVQEGRSDLDRRHAAFAGQEAGEGNFELAVGEEEDRLAGQGLGGGGNGLFGTGARGGDDGVEERGVDVELGGEDAEPFGGAFGAEGEGGGQVARAAALQGGVSVAEKRLGQGEDGVRADGGQVGVAAGGQAADGADAEGLEEGEGLILDHVGQCADEEEFAGFGLRQDGDHRGEAGVFALGEGGFDAGAGVVQHADMGGVLDAHAFGSPVEVELDDLGRAGADEEQLADVGAAGEEAVNLAVKLGLGIDEAGEVFFFEDRGAETGFGEDHHASGRLQEVGAGAAAHDEEERVLHLAVQPDDSRQAAEHLALTALLENRSVGAAAGGEGRVHAANPCTAAARSRAAMSRRASRSFQMNCAALIT